MDNEFASLGGLNIGEHGDGRERELWPTVSGELSNYELFWRTLIVLLTNRIVPSISASEPDWIRLRSAIPREYEQLTMHNYSIFYFAATARRAIQEDQAALLSQRYPLRSACFLRFTRLRTR